MQEGGQVRGTLGAASPRATRKSAFSSGTRGDSAVISSPGSHSKQQWASSSAPVPKTAGPDVPTAAWPMPQRITDPNARRSLGVGMSQSRDAGTVKLTNRDQTGQEQKLAARVSYTAPRPPVLDNLEKPERHSSYQVTLQTTGRQTWQTSTQPQTQAQNPLLGQQGVSNNLVDSSGAAIPSRPARPTPSTPPSVPPPRPASVPRTKRVALREGTMCFNQRNTRYGRLTLYNLCVWRSQDSMVTHCTSEPNFNFRTKATHL